MTVSASLASRSAAAQAVPGRVSLHWVAPGECPDEPELVREVEALLGQSLLDVGAQSLTVHVRAYGTPSDGYSAKISFASPRGEDERYLEHPSCKSLAQAVSLLVALAIDPKRVHATQRARNEEIGAEIPPPATMPAQPPAVPLAQPASTAIHAESAAQPPPTKPPRVLLGLRLAVQGLASTGILPSFGPGVQTSVGWYRAHLGAELVGRYWLPRQRLVSATRAASIEIGLLTLGARACWEPLAGPWLLSSCAGGDLGQQRGTSEGLENQIVRRDGYADVALSFSAAYVRSALFPQGGLELSRALERPHFGLTEDGVGVERFRSAPWALSAFFGLAFER